MKNVLSAQMKAKNVMGQPGEPQWNLMMAKVIVKLNARHANIYGYLKGKNERDFNVRRNFFCVIRRWNSLCML